MIIVVIRFEKPKTIIFKEQPTGATKWNSFTPKYFVKIQVFRPLNYVAENFALYILKMADLGFIQTISEDDDVSVADESTDSDEEVLRFLKCLISSDSCDG